MTPRGPTWRDNHVAPLEAALATVAAMASVVAILDLKGKPLIQRSYRDDVDPGAMERFLPLLTEVEEEHGTSAIQPCLSSQGVNYMHVRHNNLYRTYE